MILNELKNAGQIPRRFYQRRLPSDMSKDYYYIIRNTPNNETLIVEYGFLDNEKDANKLKNNYKKYAEAVVKAVAEYGGYDYNKDINNDYYTVKTGDTLWSIAKNNNITVDELKRINNLTSNTLTVGEKLLINNNTNYENYVVKKGDTLYSIAKLFNVAIDDLKRINNLTNNTLSIGQVLNIPKDINNLIYEVKKGDTLYSIAKDFNTTVNDIKMLNNLVSNILSIGQKLMLPVV